MRVKVEVEAEVEGVERSVSEWEGVNVLEVERSVSERERVRLPLGKVIELNAVVVLSSSPSSSSS